MSLKAADALLTLVLGSFIGGVWLRTFWSDARRVPLLVLAAPLVAGLLGREHWVADDFSVRHWAGDVSLAQALCNATVVCALCYRRWLPHGAATALQEATP
jgi:hypothetical protein